MLNPTTKTQFERSYQEGRKRALKAKVLHRCNDLVPAEQLLDKLDLTQRQDLGVQEVQLAQIVGSEGRAQDFDLEFAPRRRGSAERWQRAAERMLAGERMPAPILTKIGERYYVTDGHHRISVAHSQGQETIRARVMEVDASPLRKKGSCQRTGFALRDIEY